MIRLLVAVFLVCACSTVAGAQQLPEVLPTHGHPQLAAYTSRAAQAPLSASVEIDCRTPEYTARCAVDHAEMAKALDALPPSTQVLDTGLPEVIPLHNYPYGGKTQYDTRAEWLSRFWSAQGHWLVNGMLTHTHTECAAPIYARIAKSAIVTLPCRAVLFHNPGRVEDGYGSDGDLTWADPAPRVGNPMGLVTYAFTVRFDAAGRPNNPRPENGWYTPAIALFTTFDAVGVVPLRVQNTSLHLPFFIVGDPAVPETVWLGPVFSARTMIFGAAFGQAIVDCYDYLPVLAPVTEKITVNCSSFVYARDRHGLWPAPQNDTQEQLDDLDIHNGSFGRTVSRFTHTEQRHPFSVLFDPFVQAGPRKTAVIWHTNSGPGDAAQNILPNEELWTLLVFPWVADPGGAPPPPPPPPPTSTPCIGSWGLVQTSPTTIERVFTITAQPTNGGTSCLVVAGSGG